MITFLTVQNKMAYLLPLNSLQHKNDEKTTQFEFGETIFGNITSDLYYMKVELIKKMFFKAHSLHHS